MKQINEYADNNDEQDALQEYAAIDHHQEIWNELFGASQVDWRAYLPHGSFDEHKDSPEHFQDIGLRIVQMYRASFEEDNGYWADETTAPRAFRACDIKNSLLGRAMFLDQPELPTIERES